MKLIIEILAINALFLLGVSNCQTDQSELHPTLMDSIGCKETVAGFKVVELADNELAKIELYEFEHGQNVDTLYFIKFPLSRNLVACNLPEKFKRDGLRVRFSGEIYNSESTHTQYRLWLPIILTEIELVAK